MDHVSDEFTAEVGRAYRQLLARFQTFAELLASREQWASDRGVRLTLHERCLDMAYAGHTIRLQHTVSVQGRTILGKIDVTRLVRDPHGSAQTEVGIVPIYFDEHGHAGDTAYKEKFKPWSMDDAEGVEAIAGFALRKFLDSGILEY